jgi:chromosome segregation ATPase
MEKENECEKVIAELTDAKVKLEVELNDTKSKTVELTETNRKLDAELKELKAKPPAPSSDAMVAVQAELKAVKAECEALKAWKAAAEDADHMRRVQDVVDLRVKAGLLESNAVEAAVESLKKLPNDALDAMKADLDAVKAKFDSLPSGPKARLIPSVAARFDPMQPTVGDLVGKKPGEK